MHIGEKINTELKRQGRTVTWFARSLNVVRTNAYDIFNRSSIDTNLLKKISLILNHNFFADLSNNFEKTKENVKLEEVLKRKNKKSAEP